MVICTRRGCGVDFDPAASTSAQASCSYHPGAPVFHEGLKSWSCCKDTNKPVMEFDQFLAIPGCASAESHSTEKQSVPTVKGGAVVAEADATTSAADLEVLSKDTDGRETFGKTVATSDIVQPLSGMSLLAAQNAAQSSKSDSNTAVYKEPVEEEDPIESDVSLPAGLTCKRGGCGFKFEGGARDRSQETCKYHKGSPIFHEGSKGWSCCKRRVLDFNDFLQIEPCTTAKSGHLFVGAPKTAADGSADGEESIDCRMDHYETPNDVRLTVYAKAVDTANSSIQFKEDGVVFSLLLPPAPGSSRGRRFKKTLNPFAPIVPTESSFNITKFKVDLVLAKKAKGQSWPCLESGDRPMGYGLTFGRDKDK